MFLRIALLPLILEIADPGPVIAIPLPPLPHNESAAAPENRHDTQPR